MKKSRHSFPPLDAAAGAAGARAAAGARHLTGCAGVAIGRHVKGHGQLRHHRGLGGTRGEVAAGALVQKQQRQLLLPLVRCCDGGHEACDATAAGGVDRPSSDAQLAPTHAGRALLSNEPTPRRVRRVLHEARDVQEQPRLGKHSQGQFVHAWVQVFSHPNPQIHSLLSHGFCTHSRTFQRLHDYIRIRIFHSPHYESFHFDIMRRNEPRIHPNASSWTVT
ncbi:hypothetical protein GN958_ATG22247 [Phytophthora infestans]|uniref:Uncharacterized protein n=1 Tax=Phytophthora infestans TaxID=4787 RepID=A0A8S9TKQ2_PHYIN|nr:hypothetical protein GN958_ATG22247 [Phytophthora infestans]